nr:hypothetical protein [Chlamydiota bacterium]
QGGDGGFVEVSGKESLDFKGSADRTAFLGKGGTLLLDPTNLTIVTGDIDEYEGVEKIGGPFPIPVQWLATSHSRESRLTTRALRSSLDTGPVEVTTSSSGKDPGWMKVIGKINYGSPHTLTLSTDENLYIEASIQNNGTGDIICNVEGDLWVDGESSNARLGSKRGNLYISTGGSVRLVSAKGAVGEAQIGYDGPLSTGNINLAIGGGLYMQSGEKFVLIGHTNSSFVVQPINIKGDITISSVGAKIEMRAGDRMSQFCQIGHASPTTYDANQVLTVSGDISITNAASGISMYGGTGTTGPYTLIGHGGTASSYDASYSGNIRVQSTGPILVSGGSDTQPQKFCGIGFGQALSGVATHTFTSDLISVETTGDLSIVSGKGANHAFIGAYTGGDRVIPRSNTICDIGLLSVTAKNINIRASDAAGSSADATIGFVGDQGTVQCDIEVVAVNNLTINGGSRASKMSFAHIRNGIGNPLNKTFTGSGKIDIVVQDGNLNLQAGRKGIAYISSAGELNIDVQRGDLTIGAQEEVFISANGDTSIFAAGDINIDGDPKTTDPASIFGTRGTMRVRAGHDINFSRRAFIKNANGNLDVIAANDIKMSSASSIENSTGDRVTIAASNASMGKGSLYMPKGAAIKGGQVRIFSAQQGHTIDGLINGSLFTPELLYTTQLSEKNIKKVSASSVKNVERSQLLVSEMLTDLHPFYEFLGWFLEFQNAYDMSSFEKVHEKGTSSFQVNPDQLYYLRMKKNFDHNPQVHHMILFPKISTEEGTL